MWRKGHLVEEDPWVVLRRKGEWMKVVVKLLLLMMTRTTMTTTSIVERLGGRYVMMSATSTQQKDNKRVKGQDHHPHYPMYYRH